MAGMISSTVIVFVCLGLFMWEKVNRTVVAILGALAMVMVGRFMGFYSETLAMEKVDLFTILLLLGMMIMVSLLEPTGFFQYLALLAGRLSRGSPVRLLILLGVISSVVSMFLDNITTIVLIAPVTILICEVLGLESRPFLMTEAIFSNIGGVATLIGDPPNVIIASASGLTFLDFITHSLPVVIVVWVVVLFFMLRIFRKDLKAKVYRKSLKTINPREAIKDGKTVKRVLVVLGIAILSFFLQSILEISPAYIALGAAAFAFLWVAPDVKQTLKRIEWDVLIFFGALFILIGGLEASGALYNLALVLNDLKVLPPVYIGLILLWVIAILSAFIDNIPITIAMIPILLELQSVGVAIQPLWWALVFGAGFGGNGTIIGATTNIVITSLSERTNTPITPGYWNKRGLPVLLISCLTASVLYLAVGLTVGW